MIIIRKNSNPRMEDWFSKCYLFGEFRMKYFNDIKVLYENIFLIFKYCPISNSNVNTVITNMNNIESSTDSDSSNEVYNINNSNNRYNIVNKSSISNSENRNINISNSKNNSIVTDNVVNSSLGENRVNLSNFLQNKCVSIICDVIPIIQLPPWWKNADIMDLNYKKEWDVLFKNQIISGDYSKTSFLVTEIMPRAST